MVQRSQTTGYGRFRRGPLRTDLSIARQRQASGQPQEQTQQQQQQEQEMRQQESDQIQFINSLNTYKGGTTAFGKRLFSKSPQYSPSQIAGAGTIDLPYFTGTFKEYDPARNLVLTYRVDQPRFGSRGNPLNPLGILIKTEPFEPVSNSVVNAYNSAADSWVARGSTSQEAAKRQRQIIESKVAKREAERIAKARVTPGTSQYYKQQIRYQEERIAYNRNRPISKRLNQIQWSLLRNSGLTPMEIRNIKPVTLKNAIIQLRRREVSYYRERDKRLATEYLKMNIYRHLTEKIRRSRVYENYLNELLNKLNKQQQLSLEEIQNANRITNWITAQPKLKGLDYLRDRLDILKSIQLTTIERSPQTTRGLIERELRTIVALGLIGALRGGINSLYAISHPIKTAMNLYNQVRHPLQTLKVLGNEFAIDPVGTIAEFYTYNLILKAVSTGIKRSPVGRFVQEELFIRAQPIQLRPYIRAIIKSSKAQESINPRNIKSIKPDFIEVKSLTRLEAKALTKTLRQTDSVVFGGGAGRILSKKRLPLPKDVDLATKNIKVFEGKFLQNLPKKLRNNYLIKGQKLIRRSNNKPIFDIKPLNRLIPNQNILTRRGYLPVSGYVSVLKTNRKALLPYLTKEAKVSRFTIPTQKIVKIRGIKFVGLGEQITRKGLGTIQVLIEKNSRRAKDPQGFIQGLQVQLENIKRTKPLTPIGKIQKANRINTIQSALKVLTSKDFLKLLEQKAPGLLKKYPLLKKINLGKLKRAKKLSQTTVKTISRRTFQPTKQPTIEQPTKLSRLPSKLPQRQYSSLLARLPKKYSSKLPSRTPSNFPFTIRSVIPRSRIPSVLSTLNNLLPKRLPPSKFPLSRLASSRLPYSRLPPSRLPPSRLPPSRLPPSRLPPSRLPPSRLPPSRLPPSRLPPSRLPPSRLPPSRLPPSRLPPPIPPKTVVYPYKIIRSMLKIRNPRGYFVYTKKFGRKYPFIRTTKSPFKTRNYAHNHGMSLVDNNITASYILLPTLRKGTLIFKSKGIAYKFRRVRPRTELPIQAIVEKAKYRLDKPGEKRQIIYRGRRRKPKKRKKKSRSKRRRKK